MPLATPVMVGPHRRMVTRNGRWTERVSPVRPQLTHTWLFRTVFLQERWGSVCNLLVRRKTVQLGIVQSPSEQKSKKTTLHIISAKERRCETCFSILNAPTHSLSGEFLPGAMCLHAIKCQQGLSPNPSWPQEPYHKRRRTPMKRR